MTLIGHIAEGRVVLDVPTDLPDGTRVQIEVIANGVAPHNRVDTGSNGVTPPEPDEPPKTLAQRWKSVLDCTVDLPEDAAYQHDHYLYGLPKK